MVRVMRELNAEYRQRLSIFLGVISASVPSGIGGGSVDRQR